MTSKETINGFLYALFGFKKPRNILHIILIILIHCAGWCLLFFLPVLLYPVRVNDDSFIKRELIDKSILVVIFYFNYYVLIPRFFEKKKYLGYCIAVLLLFVVYMAQHLAVRTAYFPRRGGPFTLVQSSPVKAGNGAGRVVSYRNGEFAGSFIVADTGGPMGTVSRIPIHKDSLDKMMPPFPMAEKGWLGIPKGFWVMGLNNATTSFALLLLIGGFLRLAVSFVKNQNEKKALENANLNAEVNFLKSQINPHFLFNTLNGIYSQAHTRSEHTEHSILRLSNLLRYVLYESSGEKVELAKDIQYLSNYIDLQKLRLSQKVTVNYEVEGNTGSQRIAPLLLITFVENAFKHGISYSTPSTISIHVSIFEQTLTLVVSNPVLEKNRFAGGGLGIKNVTRRLDLLYPGKYLLDIVHTDCLHIVNLKIDLRND